MFKKVVTLACTAAVIAAAGGVAYADASGIFLKNTDAAKLLVNKYMESVMRSYRGEENVSFRGIVREGCDFWYYNDYNNDLIHDMSVGSGTAEKADFYVTFGSVEYSDRVYTVEARIDQQVRYKNFDETIESSCLHVFTIEQNGRNMYITNDVSDGTDKLLAPVEN